MKSTLMLIIALYLPLSLQAQVQKSVNLSIPGSLNTILTDEELAAITDLTITGTMDARDFRILRDSMPALTTVDLSEVTIAAYSGTGGPFIYSDTYDYPANETPGNSFNNKRNLLMVTLPSSLTSIGDETFIACHALTKVIAPSSVVSIGKYAFYWCQSLTDFNIPSSVTEIKYGAFLDCYALKSVIIPSSVTSIKESTFSACRELKSITIPSSVTSIGNKSFSYCPELTSITIPESVTSIGSEAFLFCSGLTSITIPASVTSIGQSAFYKCDKLTSITAHSSIPIDISNSWNVFYGIDTATCKLMVPYQSKERYAAAEQWKNFATIEEAPSGIALDVSHLEVDAFNHSHTFAIASNVEWTVSASDPWLTVDVSSGNTDQRVTITIEANPALYRRKGLITVSASDIPSQFIAVTQEGQPKTITLTAGSLNAVLTEDELKGITNLTLEGTIDARDFKVLRDQMSSLTNLDLSRTTIAAYTGREGTIPEFDSYPDNTIPKNAFLNENNYGINDKIETIVLPTSITAIDNYAFFDCEGLTSVHIPEGVTEIQTAAFSQCSHLSSVTLPSTLIILGDEAFRQCTSLQAIDIPSGVTSIGWGAFYYCSSLEWVNIPVTMTLIRGGSFSDCRALNAITASSCIPVDLSQSKDVFRGVNYSACKLMVPYRSKARYAAAPQWKDFTIVEAATGVFLEVNHLEFDSARHSYTLEISANVDWTLSSSQSWLSSDATSGKGDHKVTLTIEANPTVYTRMVQVTVSSANATSQIINVTQEGQTKTITLTAGSLNSLLTDEEQKGITRLSLEGTIDARDFRVLRDRMPSLSALDLSRATVVAYKGTDGTYFDPAIAMDYPANEIPDYALSNGEHYSISDHIKTIELPLSIKSIGEYAFTNCHGLTSIAIPEGVTEIGNLAFYDCISLTSVSLPSSLTYIGELSFYRCNSLRTIYNYSVTPFVIQRYKDLFGRVDFESCILYVPAGSRNKYAIAYQWKDFKHIIDLTTKTRELELNKTTFTCYPNPFTQQLSIEIANPSLREVSVEIYSISGLKIRTLARALKGQKITLTWDDEDEQGRQVPEGMYMVKMNGEVRKVVRR